MTLCLRKKVFRLRNVPLSSLTDTAGKRSYCTIVQYHMETAILSSMPDNPSYIHKLEGILAEARTPKPIPFFRRRDIEALFGLKKRQAVNLMHRIGAVRVSRELAVEQRDLIRWLEQMIADPSVAAEWHRHERVIDRIVEFKAETAARAVKIVLPDPRPCVELPDGVSLEPGVLTVVFDDDQQLLERLFLLARALAGQPEMLSRLNQTAVNSSPRLRVGPAL